MVLIDHFSDEESARALVEPFLRGWEIDADLDQSVGAIRLKFLRADVIDRNPPPPGSPYIFAAKAESVSISDADARAQMVRRSYPSPSIGFQITQDVERAHWRWLGFRGGHEPLQAMAYFVLTLAEASAV